MNKDDRVTEIWFPGAHSDVGGGFWYDGLSDITLKFMVDEMKTRKLGLTITEPSKINYQQLKAPEDEYRIDFDDVFIKPNHRGKIHQQDRWWPIARATLTGRDVRVNVNDKPSKNDRAIIHHTVLKRIKDIVEYRPKVLKGVPHTLCQADGTTSDHNGIVDHIKVR